MSRASFEGMLPGLESPATRHFAITPNDTVDLDPRPRVLYCVSNGDVNVMDDAGVTLVYTVVAGELLRIRARRVLLTGTTATVRGWL